jgi:hypothetical protein
MHRQTAPIEPYGSGEARPAARWLSGSSATAALLDAAKLKKLEEGEDVSSDSDELPRWTTTKRTGVTGAMHKQGRSNASYPSCCDETRRIQLLYHLGTKN